MEQTADDHIKHGDAMSNPEAKWLGSSTQTRFWFKSCAAEGKSTATELYRVVDHLLK
jgi:hypothetical protein